MENEVKDFINETSKKLSKIEKKIKEMKLNIVIMSFYTDLKLIEDSIIGYQSQGIEIDEALYEKIEKFKIMLQSKRDLPALGKKFIELTEEFYKLRKRIQNISKSDDLNTNSYDKKLKNKSLKKKNQHYDDFLLAYS